MFVDANGDEAQDVFAQTLLALDFVERGRRRVDIEQGEMRLPVLVHPEGETLHTPIFGFCNLAAEAFDDALELGGHFLDLLRGHVLTRKKHVLV